MGEEGSCHYLSGVLFIFCFGFINDYHFPFQLGKYIYNLNKNALKNPNKIDKVIDLCVLKRFLAVDINCG